MERVPDAVVSCGVQEEKKKEHIDVVTRMLDAAGSCRGNAAGKLRTMVGISRGSQDASGGGFVSTFRPRSRGGSAGSSEQRCPSHAGSCLTLSRSSSGNSIRMSEDSSSGIDVTAAARHNRSRRGHSGSAELGPPVPPASAKRMGSPSATSRLADTMPSTSATRWDEARVPTRRVSHSPGSKAVPPLRRASQEPIAHPGVPGLAPQDHNLRGRPPSAPSSVRRGGQQ
jgi:hypothetical protein